MKYLLVSIINLIYGILLLFTLSLSTPGYFLVLAIGSILTILGISGFILWLKETIKPKETIDSKESTINNWFGMAKAFDIVLIIGLLFRFFVMQPFIVEGVSMEPSFHDKEVVLIDKFTYHLRDPKPGETVIFQAPRQPQEDYIKRLIGTPGETIVITGGKVFVNGYLVKESYLATDTLTVAQNPDKVYRRTLGPNEFFVMGDNRNNSSDSRDWGIVPRVNFVGRAIFTVYPWENKGIVKTNPPILIKDKKIRDYSYNVNPIINRLNILGAQISN